MNQGDAPEKLRELKSGHIRYLGQSMYPTFQAPEILQVEPYGNRVPLIGDVIVFRCSGQDQITIHRITGTHCGQYITRGDARGGPDTRPVNRDAIEGKVTGVLRENRVCKVSNGFRGRIHAFRVRMFRRLFRSSSGR